MSNFNVPNCEKCLHNGVCKYQEITIKEVVNDLDKIIDNNIYMVDDFEVTLKCKQFVDSPTPKNVFHKL